MALLTAIRLVHSLSGAEKRAFALSIREKPSGTEYLSLFRIIASAPSAEVAPVREEFLQAHPHSSLDNTARYLVKVLADQLVQWRVDKDPHFQAVQGLLRAKVLKERSLEEESFRELKRVQRQARSLRQHAVEYLASREELNYLAERNFPGLDGNQLINMQLQAKHILREMHQIQDHFSLLELLKLRLLESGVILSPDDRKKLNDLVLSELILLTDRSKKSFDQQKLHLLFQSFYFTHAGDHQSALKVFRELDALFSAHLQQLEVPPTDYLETLSGILDSLRTLGHHPEIAFYADKVEQLDRKEYPEYFRFQVRKTVMIYRLASWLAEGDTARAIAYVSAADKEWLTAYSMVNEEIQWELYFYCALASYLAGDSGGAHGYIRTVLQHQRAQAGMMICRATRILNLLIHYEWGDTDYLTYEVRSCRRFFQQAGKLLSSEQLLFRYLRLWPDVRRKTIPAARLKALRQALEEFRADKAERRLLKYFDFVGIFKKRVGLDPADPEEEAGTGQLHVKPSDQTAAGNAKP